MRIQLKVNWSRETRNADIEPAIRKYLEFAKTDNPSEEDFNRFREYLQDKKLARNTSLPFIEYLILSVSIISGICCPKTMIARTPYPAKPIPMPRRFYW